MIKPSRPKEKATPTDAPKASQRGLWDAQDPICLHTHTHTETRVRLILDIIKNQTSADTLIHFNLHKDPKDELLGQAAPFIMQEAVCLVTPCDWSLIAISRQLLEQSCRGHGLFAVEYIIRDRNVNNCELTRRLYPELSAGCKLLRPRR